MWLILLDKEKPSVRVFSKQMQFVPVFDP